jgi:ABC-type polysaccharide transport system permease subunit
MSIFKKITNFVVTHQTTIAIVLFVIIMITVPISIGMSLKGKTPEEQKKTLKTMSNTSLALSGPTGAMIASVNRG